MLLMVSVAVIPTPAIGAFSHIKKKKSKHKLDLINFIKLVMIKKSNANCTIM